MKPVEFGSEDYGSTAGMQPEPFDTGPQRTADWDEYHTPPEPEWLINVKSR